MEPIELPSDLSKIYSDRNKRLTIMLPLYQSFTVDLFDLILQLVEYLFKFLADLLDHTDITFQRSIDSQYHVIPITDKHKNIVIE